MRLELYVCPVCGEATLRNPSGYSPSTPRCVKDTSSLSFVHEVDLRPADLNSAGLGHVFDENHPTPTSQVVVGGPKQSPNHNLTKQPPCCGGLRCPECSYP